MEQVIGIDAGGSKTLAILANEHGVVVAMARAGGANVLLQGDGGVELALGAVLDELAAHGRPSAICLGIAGAGGPAERKRLDEVLQRLGIAPITQVTSDATIALVAGSGERFGVVAIAGTGSIAFGIARDERTARAGGWGPILADEGSVFWLGRELLRRSVRALDGLAPKTALADLVAERLSIDLRSELPTWVYGSDGFRERVIPLAPLLEEAVAQGDGVAGAILDEAAAHLAAAARAVARELDFVERYPVVLAGGAFRACPSLARRFSAVWRESLGEVKLLESEPALGAVRLALGVLGSR